MQDDGRVLVPAAPGCTETGVILPNPDEERQETERALEKVAVALNRFAEAVRVYSDSDLTARRNAL